MKPPLSSHPGLRLLLNSVLAFSCSASALATTALNEDFESMADGPLDGQNGWIGSGTTLQMAVDSTTQLGTRVLDGLDTPARPPYEFAYATKPLALGDRFRRLVATFDGYAVQNSGGLPSHSSGVRIVATTHPADPGFGSHGPGWRYDRTNQGWQFDGRFGAANSNFAVVPGGFDEAVTLEIIVDRDLLETWGTWSFAGGGSGETPHYPLAVEQVDAIDAAQVDQDFRFAASRGIEIDNIVVEYTPLCGTLLVEDFESMQDGPLDGQNGWTAAPTALQMAVDSTTQLGTRVLDGLDTPVRPPYEFTYATKPLELPDGFGALIARFDAFALQDSGGLPSHSSGFRLGASAFPVDPGFGSAGPAWIYDRINRGWQFDGRFGAANANFEIVPGGFDKEVTLGIVVDRTTMETWGTWDFGGDEAGETAHFPLTLEQIDAIDLAILSQDFRFAASRGVEIDNLAVRCTPPIPLPQTEVALSSNKLTLSWRSLPGFGYQPQMPLPGLTGWTDIPRSFQAGNGQMQSFHYQLGDTPPAQMFLRLSVEPLTADLGDGLALYLPLDGDVTDHSPNGNDGTNSGAIPAPDREGRTDRAYFFDGSGTQIQVADNPSLDATELTLAFWFKVDSGSVGELVNKLGGDGNISFGSEYVASGNRVDFRISTDGTLATLSDLPATTPIETGRWYHFAGTYDGSEMRLYLDGTLDASLPKSGPIFNSSEDLRIGRYGFFPGWVFHGCIDEVAIWNRALSAAEVAALYARGGRP